ncbi:hypothetical protein COHA_000147 [Chlorella ohadii]|uniref:Uncharacterized protein n=1 Tax=Chlorella ohadii TaxID=2649997 RepID=A0AAD5DYF6_9CHLO|nr:hypothetical protein COHA_000147 [Chlorella ohadii]
MRQSATLLLAALVALAAAALPAHAGSMNVPAETLTGVDYCLESAKPAGATKQLCYLCHPTRASAWRADGTGTVSQCRAATTGTTCTSKSGDPNCAYCDEIYCIKCKTGFEFNPSFKASSQGHWLPSPEQELAVSHLHARYDCVPGQLLWSAVRLAELVGSKIKAYHTRLPWPFTMPVTLSSPPADGACTLCLNQYHVLVPLNALYINAAGQGSTCMTAAKVQSEALAITGKAAVLPNGCREVDTEFKCNRCADTYSLTDGKCVRGGNKCKSTLSYNQYCAKCDATGLKCLACNGSRSPPYGAPDNRCTFPCKQLYGIGCLKCNQWKCLVTDTKYAKGR